MAKSIIMQSRGRIYHNIQKCIQTFYESDLKSCLIKEVYVDEWANEDSCRRSFKRSIYDLGLTGRIRISFTKNGRIRLIRVFA